MKALIGLTVGIFFGYIFPISINKEFLAVILLAAAEKGIPVIIMEPLREGIAAKLHLNFSDKVLIGGFFTNLIFALALILLGKIFNLELYYIALLIFGLRIFKNISAVKEFFLKNAA